MIGVKRVERRELNFLERIYIVEILKGLLVTVRHFFRNVTDIRRVPTIRYPEEVRPLQGAGLERSRHRLKKRPDGKPKCVACYMCATYCPAYCIYIEAGEYPDDPIEKYPVRFEIDLSRCVFCGLCVEACPEDAIAMDTGIIPGGEYDRFRSMRLTKETLLMEFTPEKRNFIGAAGRLWAEWLGIKKNDKKGVIER
jgi:NADH-quinone oxidoreductase subunit I